MAPGCDQDCDLDLAHVKLCSYTVLLESDPSCSDLKKVRAPIATGTLHQSAGGLRPLAGSGWHSSLSRQGGALHAPRVPEFLDRLNPQKPPLYSRL